MVSVEREEEALRFLLEQYEKSPEAPDVPSPVFVKKFGKDAKVLADLLVSDGFIEIQSKVQQKDEHRFVTTPHLILTAKGRVYFLKQQRDARISRKQFIQSAVVAVVSAVISSLLTLLVSFNKEKSSGSTSSNS